MTLSAAIQHKYTHWQPHLLLLAYLILVAASFLAPLSITATNIAITAAAGLAIISGKFFKEFNLVRSNPIVLSILILLALVTAGMFWSVASWSERLIALHKYQKLLYFIFLIPLCAERRWCDRAINAFILAVALTVVIAILVKYTGLHLGKIKTEQFIFHSRIETSYFVAFATYILIWRALYGQRYHWLYWLLALLFTFHEFFINDGRTGWVVYFGLMILFFVQYSLRPLPKGMPQIRYWLAALRAISLGGLAIIFTALVLYNVSSSFHDRAGKLMHDLRHPKQTVHAVGEEAPEGKWHERPDLRIPFFEYAIKLTAQHPVMGMGTASFQAVYRQAPFVAGWKSLNNPHSEYLLILVQGGIIGLAALLYFFYTQVQVSLQVRHNRAIAQALILSGVISCFFNAFLYTTTTGHFYVLFMSLLLAEYSAKPTIKRLSGKEY